MNGWFLTLYQWIRQRHDLVPRARGWSVGVYSLFLCSGSVWRSLEFIFVFWVGVEEFIVYFCVLGWCVGVYSLFLCSGLVCGSL